MPSKIFLTSSVSFVAKDIAKKLGGVKNKKILYIYTAAEKKLGADWQIADRTSLVKVGFKVIDYTITGKTSAAIKKDINNVDAIYVGGGNQFYLLQQIQLTKSAPIFRQAVKNGKIYISTSAGSMVSGPDIYSSYKLDKVKEAPRLKGYKGLGLVDLSVLPHWGSDKQKNNYRLQRLANNYNIKNKLILLTNYQYLQIEDGWYRMIDVKNKTA